MVSVSIPNIEITENRIQNCSIIIDGTTFNAKFSDGTYIVTNGGKSKKQADPTSVSEAAGEGVAPAEDSKVESKPRSKSSKVGAAAEKEKKTAKPGSITPFYISNAAVAFSKMAKK